MTAPIHSLTDAELEAAIARATQAEVDARHYRAELMLHRMMRTHIKRENIKAQIAALQDVLDETGVQS